MEPSDSDRMDRSHRTRPIFDFDLQVAPILVPMPMPCGGVPCGGLRASAAAAPPAGRQAAVLCGDGGDERRRRRAHYLFHLVVTGFRCFDGSPFSQGWKACSLTRWPRGKYLQRRHQGGWFCSHHEIQVCMRFLKMATRRLFSLSNVRYNEGSLPESQKPS